MEQVLNHLAELQKVDSEIMKIESLRGDLPQQVEQLQAQLNAAQAALAATKHEYDACLKEKAGLELKVKEENGKKEKYKGQLYEVKTNREYDAISMEIEAVDIRIGEAEDRILQLIDMEEGLKEKLGQKEETFKTLSDEFGAKKENLLTLMAKTEKEELTLRDQRNKILRNIDMRTTATYNRIQKKYGNAIVPVVRRACGGCFKALPPQRVLETRKRDKLILCEVCGRILVWDDAQSENE
ncbi:hypothetical protein JXO52_04890 [bacterium]|nr:hypothetical protein [bacterium]